MNHLGGELIFLMAIIAYGIWATWKLYEEGTFKRILKKQIKAKKKNNPYKGYLNITIYK